MSFYLKTSAYLMSIFIGYKLNVYLRKRLNKSKDNTERHFCLFFPEEEIQLQDCYQQSYDQLVDNNPNSQLSQLLSVLKTCKHSLDVCMYCLSFKPIVQLIQDLGLNDEIVVRIIINGQNKQTSIPTEEQNDLLLSSHSLQNMFKSGIELKIICPSNEGLMHNKYAIIDNSVLINGSLNWTENAIFHSFNDCIITSDPKLVLRYSQHFNNFWSIE